MLFRVTGDDFPDDTALVVDAGDPQAAAIKGARSLEGLTGRRLPGASVIHVELLLLIPIGQPHGFALHAGYIADPVSA